MPSCQLTPFVSNAKELGLETEVRRTCVNVYYIYIYISCFIKIFDCSALRIEN